VGESPGFARLLGDRRARRETTYRGSGPEESSMQGSTRIRGALACALIAAASASAGGAWAQEKITVGALRFTSHAPTFIAYERGYFKEEGLDVELKFFQAAQPVAVAIASGDIDFGVTALTGGFFNLADKGALKIVGGLFAEKKGYKGMAIMASNKAYAAGLNKPAKLKDHSVALTQVGSSFHYMTGMIAAKYGFGMSDVSLKPLQKVGSMIGAVKSGQVDAMMMVPHVAIPLDKAKAAKIIGWMSDLGDYQVTTIFTSTRNTTDRQVQVKRFLRAYKKGIADYRAVMLDQKKDPAATEAMVKLIHKYVYTDRPYEKAAPGIKAGAVYMNEGAALNVGDVKRQLEWFKAQGLVKSAIGYQDLIATGYADMINVPK
jgi:NitT/TauT family transport system substrate-binding protein